MKKFQNLLFLSFALLTLACGNDDGPGITEEQRQLIMGDATGDGVVQLGLTAPITVDVDLVHSNTRELDINFDSETDIVVRAYEDFGGNPRGLTITTSNTSTRILLDDNGNVRALNAGEVTTVLSTTWAMADALPLAVLDGQTISGIWNGLQNKYVAVRMDVGNSRFLAWIELSVDNYDNYKFHNYALKQVP
ncbi:hypothetical protein [Roseivirga misakiensis]|uniref:Uncharacterized protein n=1 Tax=Roseivirga misakiensis TaxID=1563681 RepID=A0A1E5T1P1_9BACT|nr:hypothetical protein [Roseivirga misakiensis]OEK05285.1 hypothetical protein BFP71_17960 [Roseivirga misakiensis]